MSNLHLCVVTGQPQANLIPLLQEKPDDIVLMYSEDEKMKRSALAFVQTLQKAGFAPERIHLESGLPTHPFDKIGSYLLDVKVKLAEKFPDHQITWNATGGTKQMALAIWNALDLDTDRVIYCDTRAGYIEELIPTPGTVDLQSLLTPELLLDALGKIKRSSESDQAAWFERAQQRKKLTRHLGDNVEALASLIQYFNRTLDNNGSGNQQFTIEHVGSLRKTALQLMEECNVIDLLGEGRYTLSRAESARYLTGGWLEEYVWHQTRDQGADFVECSLKFGDLANRKQGQDNEIDVFAVHRNRALLIECKSGYLGSNADKDSQIIYKLDSLGSHAGGIQATKVLISAQQLQHETKAGKKVDTRARANATDIHTLASSELKKLPAYIRHWQETGSWQAE